MPRLFAALYVWLASLDFKLDSLSSPLGPLAGLSMSIAARHMRSAKPGVSRRRRGIGTTRCETPRILPFWRFGRSPTEAWRRGRMCLDAHPEEHALQKR